MVVSYLVCDVTFLFVKEKKYYSVYNSFYWINLF